MSSLGDASHRLAVRAEMLRFAQQAIHPFGFGHLDDKGEILPDKPVELYITCRMLHVFALGVLADEPPADGGPDRTQLASLVGHGVDALLDGPLRDGANGGWFNSVSPDDGSAVDSSKQAYAHSFVMLAASSAIAAGNSHAAELLDLACKIQLKRFWDDAEGLVVEEWNADWTTLSSYRGINSNMHTVEGYVATGDVTGDRIWFARAGRIATRVARWAAENGWRIPEHFTPDWEPILEHNRDQPNHPFQPYGATIGHGLEWARLMVATHLSLTDETSTELVEAAQRLAERAVADGWARDGADGFVYTTDWSGTPVVRSRMHWVLAEAIATSVVLGRLGDASRHSADLETWWGYAEKYLADHEYGGWRNELGPDNSPQSLTWEGKPDVYHVYQAALMADVPTSPSFATALKLAALP